VQNFFTANRSVSQPPSNNCNYFIATKSGLRAITVPPGEAAFAVMHRGRWHVVFRAATDAEYFADHPEAAYRGTIRRHSASYFEFRIVTRVGRRVCIGDRWDIHGKMDLGGGSPRERLHRVARRLLADQNRTRRIRAV
jgi:hypothetical protein